MASRINIKGLPFPITDMVVIFTPKIIATFLVYQETGQNGVTKLFKRIFDFHRITKKVWYVVIILLPFWIYFVIYIVIYFTDSPFSNESNVAFQSLFGLLLLFFVGVIADEVGYMGYTIEPM